MDQKVQRKQLLGLNLLSPRRAAPGQVGSCGIYQLLKPLRNSIDSDNMTFTGWLPFHKAFQEGISLAMNAASL